jgi:hypothetical protein
MRLTFAAERPFIVVPWPGREVVAVHKRMSAKGQKQTYAVQKAMSALPPIATAKADVCPRSCSALPPKADVCSALAHVCFGPKADIRSPTSAEFIEAASAELPADLVRFRV